MTTQLRKLAIASVLILASCDGQDAPFAQDSQSLEPELSVELRSAQVVTRVEYPTTMHTTLKGVVEATDLDGEEQVIVHYQGRDHRYDASWQTVPAQPLGNGLWEFETPTLSGVCPHYCPRHVFTFAVEFRVDGASYWDNNGGFGVDYVLANDLGGSVPLYFGPPAILEAPVQLSYADWDAEHDLFDAQLLVENIAYEKRVTLVYTTDGWDTVQEAQGQFDRMSYDDLEYWRIRFALPDHGDELRFAIRYEVDGESYWDNHLGWDYRLETPGFAP